jgi:hypothetical protein
MIWTATTRKLKQQNYLHVRSYRNESVHGFNSERAQCYPEKRKMIDSDPAPSASGLRTGNDNEMFPPHTRSVKNNLRMIWQAQTQTVTETDSNRHRHLRVVWQAQAQIVTEQIVTETYAWFGRQMGLVSLPTTMNSDSKIMTSEKTSARPGSLDSAISFMLLPSLRRSGSRRNFRATSCTY